MKYTLQNDFIYETGISGNPYNCPIFSLSGTGTITIFAGFRFDGATLVPDGRIDPATGLPRTYFAALVHDVLYIEFPKHGIPRRQIERLFLRMLREANFKPAWLYYAGTSIFGGVFLKLARSGWI
jgi:hypothetical protein